MLTPAFIALTQIATYVTGRRVYSKGVDGRWCAGVDWIEIPENDAEGLLHEICHWAVATSRRTLLNYGLDGIPGNEIPRELREERMCGWVEDDLYSRAGKQRPLSSVDSSRVDYRACPELRRLGFQRFRRYISWRDREAIVDALRLDGGDVGTYEPRFYK